MTWDDFGLICLIAVAIAVILGSIRIIFDDWFDTGTKAD